MEAAAHASATRRLAWGAFIAVALSYAVGVVVEVVSHSVDLFGVFTFVFPLAGMFVLDRQPKNRIGWILMAIGMIAAASAILRSYAIYGLRLHPGSLPGADVAVAMLQPLWAPLIGIIGIHLLLLFPEGRLPSPRWRKVAWLGSVGIVGTWIFITLLPGIIDDPAFPNVRNPLGIEALRSVIPVLFAFIGLIPISIVASAVSLVLRFRRSKGTLRLQHKWVTAAAATVAALYALQMVVSVAWPRKGAGDPLVVAIVQNVAVFSFVLIPISIGFAILRYRLYDIDVVINKTVVYGAMAAFITAVYVAIVVGIGRTIGSERNIGLSILATALVAVAFQPVRERVRRLANRLVYGKRATPYDVLSEFSGGMSHTVASEELLPRMARAVAEGTGAARADVWLRVGSELVREAGWPEDEERRKDAVPVPEAAETVVGSDRAVPVRHQGELLGVIGVKKSPGETVTPADEKLLEDLASQAGLVLRNVRLIEELKTSRQRLVTAQDEERRRLERDLHDGAQQRLVAISLALRLARGLADPEKDGPLGERLDQASDELGRALNELREFARGMHPAILTERGLVPALESLAERSTVPASVEAAVDGRLPPAVEATAYFVVSEALTNVGKYSNATAVIIRAEAADGTLTVEVVDDGIGGADPSRGSGLRGLADRVAAVDGTLEIESPPGHGTRLTVRVPARALAQVTA
jgi:signal transduction histidine kinase